MNDLSIVIPTYCEEPGIKAFLNHVLQVVAPIHGVEIIVVDGGSGDQTVSTARALGVCVYRSQRGRALQMNMGAARAHGNYLLYLHSDTRLPENFAANWELIQAQGATWGFFPLRLSGTDWSFRLLERAISWRARLTRVATGEQAIFVHRNAWRLLGGYRPLALMEDVDLCKRLRVLARPSVMNSAVETSSRRWQEQGIVRTLLMTLCLRTGFWLGVDARYLTRFYPVREGDKATNRRVAELP
jgi:rSAM/selenodomain-associated transferase 2